MAGQANSCICLVWRAAPQGQRGKLPAMVLVHGGAGTAFADWVRMWKRRGYAAIAMDTCGSVPIREGRGDGNVTISEGLPAGSSTRLTGLSRISGRITRWPMRFSRTRCCDRFRGRCLAHRAYRDFLGWLSHGHHRQRRYPLQFGAPVYGCGFLGEDSLGADTGQDETGGCEEVARAVGSFGLFAEREDADAVGG